MASDMFNLGITASKDKTNFEGTKTTQKIFDQAAIDKLIYDVMSSERGLSSLASGENLSGGFNSSAKTLQTQDFLTKLIGELAVASAETVEKTDSVTRNDKKSGALGMKTVICTELARQGLLDPELYESAGTPSSQVQYLTWRGYISWAESLVPRMARSPRLSRFFLPIVEARYKQLLGRKRSVLGFLAIYVGHPICWMIGLAIIIGGGRGRYCEFA